MSQDWKYQFHMGCGEPLRSQWVEKVLLGSAASRNGTKKLKQTAAVKPVPRSGRKG